MFRCQLCGNVAPAGTRAHRVTLVTRPKDYVTRGGRDTQQRGRFRGPQRGKKDYDKGGSGHETVAEAVACENCAKTVTPVMKAPPAPEVVEEEVVAEEVAAEATETATPEAATTEEVATEDAKTEEAAE